MRYVYRCDNCWAEAEPRADWHEAKQDRVDHRERAHHGLKPQDTIVQVPGIIVGALSSAAHSAAGWMEERNRKRPATTPVEDRVPMQWQEMGRGQQIATAVVLGAIALLLLILLL